MNNRNQKKLNHEKLQKPKSFQKQQLSHKKSQSEFKKKIASFITSTPFSIFMSVLTIYTIFAIDIDKAFFTVHASFWFSVVHILSMAVFISETIFLVITESDYFLSFYFWIDIFSTFTMMLEVIWIQDLMNSVENLQMAISIARISKASRFSKIGARSTKIMKLIRLIKLMKFMQKKEEKDSMKEKVLQSHMSVKQISQKNQYQQSYNQLNVKTDEKSDVAFSYMIQRPHVDIERQVQIERLWLQTKLRLEGTLQVESEKDENMQKTKVGKILKDQIQKNIVIMVMGVIIFVPMLTADTWFTKTTQLAFTADLYLQQMYQIENLSQRLSFLQTLVNISTLQSYPLSFMNITIAEDIVVAFPKDFQIDEPEIRFDDLRESDKSVIQDYNYFLVFNKIFINRVNSVINICRSLFVTFLLILASILFIKDIDNFALIPLQKMSQTVQKIESNPFGVFIDKITRLIEIYNISKSESQLQVSSKDLQTQLQKHEIQADILPTHLEEELETNLLEKILLKICYLLCIGIGHYAQNLPNIPGAQDSEQKIFLQKVIVVSGCFLNIKIAHLPEIIQKLEEKSVLYINRLCTIVHQLALRYGGIILQQEDSQFIIFWENSSNTSSSNTLIEKNNEFIKGGNVKKIANLAFLAYCEISNSIINDAELEKYEKYLSEIQNYKRVKIVCSLNYGSANLGAFSSEFQLRVKVTGQDIIICREMCKFAEQSHAALITNQFFIKISQLTKVCVRKVVDVFFSRFQVEQTKLDFDQFYTVDLILDKNQDPPNALENNKNQNDNQIKAQIISVFRQRDFVLRQLKKLKIQEIFDIQSINPHRSIHYTQWVQCWQQALQAFQNHQWRKATNNFEMALERIVEIPHLYPSPPDFFTKEKLEFIKRWKQLSKNPQCHASQLYLEF